MPPRLTRESQHWIRPIDPGPDYDLHETSLPCKRHACGERGAYVGGDRDALTSMVLCPRHARLFVAHHVLTIDETPAALRED